MNGPQKITAAAEEAADPNAMDGVKKIMAAAGEAGCKPPGYDREAVRKLLAIGNAALDNASSGKAALRMIHAAAAEAKRHDAEDGPDRIQRAAGKPGRAEEEFSKSLAALDDLEGMASMLRRTAPTRTRRGPSPLSKVLEAGKRAMMPAGPLQRPLRPGPFEWAADGAPLAEAGLQRFAFRDRLAGDIRKGLEMTPNSLVMHAQTAYGMQSGDAAEWVEGFLSDVSRHGERRQRQAAEAAA